MDPSKFDEITETTGTRVVPEGAQMLFTRYAVAAAHATGKRVLELGCASGQGFGLLLSSAGFVVGADFSSTLLARAKSHYGERVPLVRLDAQSLPFSSNSFDLVLLFEAAYYVPDLPRAFSEIARVLAPGGEFLIASANPERKDFIPSPYSVRYHSAAELRRELNDAGLYTASLEGAFPDSDSERFIGRMQREVTQRLRRLLVRAGLVPKTLKGRSRLKRFLYPRQLTVPPEIGAAFGPAAPRFPLGPTNTRRFKVIYATARKRSSREER